MEWGCQILAPIGLVLDVPGPRLYLKIGILKEFLCLFTLSQEIKCLIGCPICNDEVLLLSIIILDDLPEILQ